MMFYRTLIMSIVSFFLAATVAGCGRSSDPPTPPVASSPAKADVPVLKLAPEMAKGVSVEEISQIPLALTLKAFGKIQFNEDRMALVLAPLPGQVTQLQCRVGDEVHQGDVLFRITSRDVSSSVAEYRESRKDLELSEKTYTMTKDLFEGQATSAISLKQAENDLAKARGRVARTLAALKTLGVDMTGEDLTSFIPVRSPIGGTITDKKVTEGQYEIGDNTPLLTIADLSSVWIVADLFERDLSCVKPGQKAEVSTAAYPNQHFAGEVSRLSDVVDPNTRTVKVRIVVPNPDRRLKPEMFASVLLTIKEAEPALTVPSRAAFIEGGQNFVYVEKLPGEFERRRVEVVPALEGKLRVQSGLKAGERVACQNVLLLRAQESSGGSNP